MTARTSILTTQGWRWRRLGSGTALHLCPPTLLAHSHAACGRPIVAASEPFAFTPATPRCLRCIRADGTR